MDSDRTVDTRETQEKGLESTKEPTRQQFTKADRFLERAQFVHLSNIGEKIQNRHFILLFALNELDRCRLGITVSKKVGNAVQRNRIKRLAREYFRKHRHVLGHHWDIHLIAKRNVADCSTQEVFISIEKLINRIESYQDE